VVNRDAQLDHRPDLLFSGPFDAPGGVFSADGSSRLSRAKRVFGTLERVTSRRFGREVFRETLDKNEKEKNTMALYENAIKLKGFVGKDAEAKGAGNASGAMTTFSLATKSSYKNKHTNEWISRTEWHRVLCFAASAEYAKDLRKGDYVEIEGELRSSEFESEVGSGATATSIKRRNWEVRATEVRKLARLAKPDDSSDSLPPEGDNAL
jgi:single-strand DNA-binding protein